MAESEAEIGNMALGKLGIRNYMVAMDDDTPEAVTVSKFYPSARDKVLRTYNWPFARKRAVLAQVASTRDGWGGVYMLPGDCLAPRLVWSGFRNPTPSQIIPWSIEYDDTYQRVFLTDQPAPLLIYTAKVTNPVLYPPLFTEAVAARLAADIATPLTGRMEVRVEMLREYKQAIGEAITMASLDEEPDMEPDSEFITGRG